MKKNVIFWVGVKSTDPNMSKKHGGFKYLDISKKCWQDWCEANDVSFCAYELDDVGKRWNLLHDRVTWTRHFDVFDVLEKKKIEYNKIAIIDGATLIHPRAPNFFNDTPETGLTVFRSLENLHWINEGITGYKDFFNGYEFNLARYFSCGFTIFGEDHKPFLKKLEELYTKYFTAIIHLQNIKVKRGTDQPVMNIFAQMEGIKVNLDVLSKRFMITHLTRFDWGGHNYQLQKDDEPIIPHYIRYSWIWFFSGFPQRGQRYEMMQRTYKMIKDL